MNKQKRRCCLFFLPDAAAAFCVASLMPFAAFGQVCSYSFIGNSGGFVRVLIGISVTDLMAEVYCNPNHNLTGKSLFEILCEITKFFCRS